METARRRTDGHVRGLIRRGDKWRIRWTDESGRRRSDQYLGREEAILRLEGNRHMVKLVRRGLAPAPPPEVTFNDLSDYWEKRRAPFKRSAGSDLSIIRCHLRPAFGNLLLRNLGTAHVESLLADRRHLEPKTLANVVILLRAMLNKAVHLGWLVKVPHIDRPPRPAVTFRENYLHTREDIDALLKAAMGEGWHVFALYATALFSGLRAGELAGLRWSDVDLEHRQITVRRSYDGPTKTGDERVVPILDPLLPVLTRWRELHPGTLVFTNRARRMLGKSAPVFQEVLRRVLDEAGLKPVERNGKTHPHITFHGMRHTFCSHWMMNGGDAFTLQKIAGHRCFQTTQIYAHLDWSRFASEHRRLGSRSLLDLATDAQYAASAVPKGLPEPTPTT